MNSTTITLKEAYKRATKGTLVTSKFTSTQNRERQRIDDSEGRLIASTIRWRSGSDGGNEMELDKANVDAALLAHAFNVLPELVEALNKAHNLLNYIASHPKAWETIHGRAVDTRAETFAALDKASKVEISS